jgi:hypothetical protein
MSDDWQRTVLAQDIAAGLPWFDAVRIDSFVQNLHIPAGQDWVGDLEKKELSARTKRHDELQQQHPGLSPVLAAADPGIVRGYATALLWTKPRKGPEERLQLAVGYLYRRLDIERMSQGIWLDTSRSGLSLSGQQPDLTLAAKIPLAMPSLVRAAPLGPPLLAMCYSTEEPVAAQTVMFP